MLKKNNYLYYFFKFKLTMQRNMVIMALLLLKGSKRVLEFQQLNILNGEYNEKTNRIIRGICSSANGS